MRHRNWLAPLVLGLALTGVATPAAEGGGCYDGRSYGGYRGGYGGGLRSVNSFRGGNRLLRHRSGYLMSPRRSFGYPAYVGGYGYGGGPAIVQAAPTADQSCAAYGDPLQDFDCRRDRLLQAATRIDVSFLENETPAGTTSTDGPGWVFLREGESAKALGRFTARLMRAPGDSGAKVGYALAAAQLGDDASAAAVMEDVMRTRPRTLRALADDAALDGVTRTLLDRYAATLAADPAAADPAMAEARVMTVALHVLRNEPEAARVAVEAAPESSARPAAPTEAVAQRD